MKNPRFGGLFLALAGAVLLTMSEWAGAEPPSRAARLGFISGTVSFSPAGEDDWRRARINRPLTTGDRLWVADNSRAELQIGGAAIRLGGGTSLTLLNLDDRMVQLQLNEGTLRVRVYRLGRSQAFEVNTPNLAFTMSRVGEYRIDVDANDDATAVLVRSGRGEVYGERRSYALNAGQGFRFYGSGVSDYDRYASRDDELDRWGRERDRRYTSSVSLRYVSGDVVGYEELDAYGSWRRDTEYGNVWAPTRVSSDWTPYRDGHWAWIDPWGWTWVDDQPWGYAVSHYGRWANSRGQWVWVPGPRTEPAVYAPALVAFVGGPNARLSISVGSAAGAIGWFPLAPREVYQPSYQVSRGYFERVNRSNAVIAPATVTNVYNTTIVNKTVVNNVYVNQRVQGAVVAVPPQAFTQSQPVAKAAVQVSKESAASAPAAPVAAVAPERQSVHGGAPAADNKPPRDRDRERRVVARTAPPPPPPAFAAQQPALAATPGRPVDDSKRGQMKPAPAAAAQPAVATTVQAPAPSAPPPAVAPAAKSADERRADAAKRDGKGEGRAEGRGEGRKGDRDSAKADAGKGDAAKADAAKADAAKAEAAKADAGKADAAKAAVGKAAADKAVADKAAADKVAADKAAADKAAADAAKQAAGKADAARAEAAAKAEAAKADAAKGAERKRDREKGEAAKDEDRRRDREKADAGKADAARAEAAKAEAARAAQAKAAADKVAADRTAAEAAKAQAAQAEAAKAAQAKTAADKAAAEKAAAAKSPAAEAAKADSVRAEAKAAREKARALRTDAEKAEDDRKKGAN